MTNFVEKMRLHEMAEEDIYFRERDRELIESLRRQQLKAVADCQRDGEHVGRGQTVEDRCEALTSEHGDVRAVLLRSYRALLDNIPLFSKDRAKPGSG